MIDAHLTSLLLCLFVTWEHCCHKALVTWPGRLLLHLIPLLLTLLFIHFSKCVFCIFLKCGDNSSGLKPFKVDVTWVHSALKTLPFVEFVPVEQQRGWSVYTLSVGVTGSIMAWIVASNKGTGMQLSPHTGCGGRGEKFVRRFVTVLALLHVIDP